MSTPNLAPRKGTVALVTAWLGTLRCRLCDEAWLAFRASPPDDYVPCPVCGQKAGMADEFGPTNARSSL